MPVFYQTSRVNYFKIFNISLSSLLLGSGTLLAAEPADRPTNAPIRQISPSIFELGKVQLDKAHKTVSFPAFLNMNRGLIEYVIVTSSGKTHESLLRTDAQPYHIHLAMLLLGAKGAGTNTFPEDPALPIPGDKVSIQINWKAADGKEKRFAIEDLVLNQLAHAKAPAGPWIYNGSRVFQGTFLAQDIGSIASLMTDPDALINNPRPGHENDKIWEILGPSLPPLNSPIQVSIKLLDQPKSPGTSAQRVGQ